ncbi:hypothetical protein L6452_07488 [Arctium lappa]|uniref:Uncharacterized protein n=1 Tax=Arctium lappa TaxID=4217 RepID=A0ACB9EKP6_ARCLA|nr:hypothetical protein L6452_07488 [Arctium lappa]
MRKVSRAKPLTPSIDSPQSTGIEIFPSGPGNSVKPKGTSFVSSQKDTIVKSGTPIVPSSTFSLVDKDDLDSSPIQGASSPPHNISPEISVPMFLHDPRMNLPFQEKVRRIPKTF